MKKLFLLNLFVLVVFSLSCATNTISCGIKAAPSRDVEMPYNTTVMVTAEANDGSGGKLIGSAFAIDKKHLVTAAHVCVAILEGQAMGLLYNNIDITSSDDRGNFTVKGGVKIVKLSEDFDLCLLMKKDHGITPVKLMSKEEFKRMKVGDDITIIGAPAGIYPVLTTGKIISFTGAGDVPAYWQKATLVVGAPAWGGNSGRTCFFKWKTGRSFSNGLSKIFYIIAMYRYNVSI